MEFKGTKGKWEFGGDTIEGKLISSRHSQNRDICTIWAYDTEFIEQRECKANALLISKAPELLEMLQKVVLVTETCSGTFEDFRERYNIEIKELIKQSTEL